MELKNRKKIDIFLIRQQNKQIVSCTRIRRKLLVVHGLAESQLINKILLNFEIKYCLFEGLW